MGKIVLILATTNKATVLFLFPCVFSHRSRNTNFCSDQKNCCPFTLLYLASWI